jgi:hypothetical protein
MPPADRVARPASAKPTHLRGAIVSHPGGDSLVKARLHFALLELEHSGELTGARSQKLSTRVDPGLVEAARRRTGLRSESDLINAGLAMLAAGDDFGPWLSQQAGRLPDDFELAL